MLDYLSQPFFQRLALTLFHFLWQGLFVAGVLVAALLVLRRPQLRYSACCGAVLSLVLLPVLTFCIVHLPETQTVSQKSLATAALPKAHNEAPVRDVRKQAGRPAPVAVPPVEMAPSGEPAEAVAPLHALVNTCGPYLVLVWILGTLLFGGRLLLSFFAIRRWKRERVELPAELRTVVKSLARRLGMRRRPAVVACRRIRDAMAVGFFQPVVLIPLAWLTQMPPDVLRSVIAHELAHIRRWDQWWNLLQRIVEAVLFYHPAVWWISRQMRVEREHRCDELAVGAVGGAVVYADALERVARFRLFESEPLLANSLGGTRMALLNRVKRVLGLSDSSGRRGWWAAGILAIGIPAVLVGTAVYRQTAQAEEVAVVDGERKEGERKEGERRRDGDRKREVRKEGDRRDGERRREGDRKRREGDRKEGGKDRRDGDRREGPPRKGDRREGPPPRGERREGPPRGERPPRREGQPANANMRELLEIIRDLRAEVQRLRREVDELKGRRPGGPPRGERPPRREPARGERPPRRDGDRRVEGERREGGDRRDGDRERGKERPRD